MSNLPHNGETVLTTAEVAKMTGKSVATINRWANSGVLPVAVQTPGLRGARLFRKSDVDKIKRREVTA